MDVAVHGPKQSESRQKHRQPLAVAELPRDFGPHAEGGHPDQESGSEGYQHASGSPGRDQPDSGGRGHQRDGCDRTNKQKVSYQF